MTSVSPSITAAVIDGAGFTSPVIADADYATDRDWHKLSLVQDTGSEFDNMQPYTTLNYIIALQGLFPSRPLSSLKALGAYRSLANRNQRTVSSFAPDKR